MDPILRRMDPVHIITPYFSRSTAILSFHLCLGLQSGLFHSGFETKIFCAYLNSHTTEIPPARQPVRQWEYFRWQMEGSSRQSLTCVKDDAEGTWGSLQPWYVFLEHTTAVPFNFH